MSRSKSASIELRCPVVRRAATGLTACLLAAGATVSQGDEPGSAAAQERRGKPVLYQLLPRLFGNKVTANRAWGTIEQNGVGKFADIDDAALAGIRELGVSHVWYTGVLHHAVIRDYSRFGISLDDPDVVKGRAGSPYAVKDYYDVDPDLAVDPARRLEEFDALIERTHRHGLRVIIDIVPNHVARHYESLGSPAGVRDFGADDDPSVAWARDNDYYYVPGEAFRVPEWQNGYRPLGGEPHPLADGRYAEMPARWTGNGARGAQPSQQDWYETVKINYGVRPDGSYAFDRLPAEAAGWSDTRHAEFWRGREVSPSWRKLRHIALYWLARGVDGFRYDMAELVPVEFWSYLNSAIKAAKPDAFLLAEVYQPDLYRDYLRLGRMDYLYDKIGLYDTLKEIVRGEASTDAIPPLRMGLADVEERMLGFLENHDEQRIASPAFAGDPRRALPAMVVTATIGSAPVMIYFGQEVGEPGEGDAGFGRASRTTIFDYWGVPAHQRWMNGGAFDGGALTEAERALRGFYLRLLNLTARNPAMRGAYADLHEHNRRASAAYDGRLLAYARWLGDERLIVVSNFDPRRAARLDLAIPAGVITRMGLGDGAYTARDLLRQGPAEPFEVRAGRGRLALRLAPLGSRVLRIESGR